MQALRQASFLMRLVLEWFALSLGVAIASPLLHPVAMEMVCTASGATKLVVQGDDGTAAHNPTLDCPLCALLDAPPPVRSLAAATAAPHAQLVAAIPATRVAAAAAAPLPARGPPAR